MLSNTQPTTTANPLRLPRGCLKSSRKGPHFSWAQTFWFWTRKEKSLRRNSTRRNFYRSGKDNGLLAEHITSKPKADTSKEVEAFQILKISLIKESCFISLPLIFSLFSFKSFDKRNTEPFWVKCRFVNAITYKHF